MRYNTPEAKTWTRHILDIFVSVLARPKFGLTIRPIEEHKNTGVRQWLTVEVISNDETFKISTGTSDFGVSLLCINGRFHFREFFPYNKHVKIRQCALNFAKKLEHKPVYDIMSK